MKANIRRSQIFIQKTQQKHNKKSANNYTNQCKGGEKPNRFQRGTAR
jgi:hypothetical protein